MHFFAIRIQPVFGRFRNVFSLNEYINILNMFPFCRETESLMIPKQKMTELFQYYVHHRVLFQDITDRLWLVIGYQVANKLLLHLGIELLICMMLKLVNLLIHLQVSKLLLIMLIKYLFVLIFKCLNYILSAKVNFSKFLKEVQFFFIFEIIIVEINIEYLICFQYILICISIKNIFYLILSIMCRIQKTNYFIHQHMIQFFSEFSSGFLIYLLKYLYIYFFFY